MEKTYYVFWTYIANYAEAPIRVNAPNPQEAIKRALGFYSADFHQKASIYVWEGAPVLAMKKGAPVAPICPVCAAPVPVDGPPICNGCGHHFGG